MSYAIYLRTKDVYDIEEETGKSIEDFLDADCFVNDCEESDYEDCDDEYDYERDE